MTTTTLAYRDSLEGARVRYTDLLSRAFDGPALPDAARVYAARTGRVWAGAVGLAGASLMGLTAAAGAMRPPLVTASPTLFLLASWPAMGVAYAIGRVFGARRVQRAAAPPETGDLHADLARLERAHPVAVARGLSTGREWASTALPMMAVGLLAPLSIHFLFCLCAGNVSGFDNWIRMSLVIVGHAHLALAALYWRFATRASRLDGAQLEAQRSRLEWRTFGIAVGISALPGALLFLIPPVLTAVTALIFHPLLFRHMTGTILAERRALA